MGKNCPSNKQVFLHNQETTTAKNASKRIIFGVLIFSAAYAICRYHIFGGVPWKDFPFYIMNKIMSMAAFILLIINFTLGPLKNIYDKIPESWLNARKIIGISAFLIAVIHILMSFLLFNPRVYGEFFMENGTMTLFTGISMLAGVLTFAILWGYNLSFQTFLSQDSKIISVIGSRKFLLWALLIGLIHLFFMGFKDWLNPSEWYGGMPPISLFTFTLGTIGYVVNLLGRK